MCYFRPNSVTLALFHRKAQRTKLFQCGIKLRLSNWELHRFKLSSFATPSCREIQHVVVSYKL